MELLEFKNVSFINDNKTILKNLTLKVNSSDFISIVGPSGSGKSTFLKLCSHLISPTDGQILFKGKDIVEYNPVELRKSIGYCFQMPYLFGDKVEENMIFPYTIRDLRVDYQRINELLHRFNLNEAILKQENKNLSGGERQRISLIRSLLFKPEIILLDEVTSALDAENTEIVEKVISELNQQDTTILWVTHNLEQSRKYANRLLTIENGEIKSLEDLK